MFLGNVRGESVMIFVLLYDGRAENAGLAGGNHAGEFYSCSVAY